MVRFYFINRLDNDRFIVICAIQASKIETLENPGPTLRICEKFKWKLRKTTALERNLITE